MADFERNDDIDPIGDLKECGSLYEELELCLADNNRDFTKCKTIMKAVRMCMSAQAQSTECVSGNAEPGAHTTDSP